MVTVGNPGNAPDSRYNSRSRPGAGAVNYVYEIGKYEITNAQYTEFLNAVAASDPYELYHANMGSSSWGGIIRSGMPGGYTYSIKPAELNGTYSYNDKPVVFVNSGDAMRFANWLHNGQPIGSEDGGTTEDGAYSLNGAVSRTALEGIARNANAKWWIPSDAEWYKAAYHKNEGVTGDYWDYPTQTNSVPNHNLPSNDTGNSANFWSTNYTTGDFHYPFTDVGAYHLSVGPYGTFDQGGNAREWTDTLFVPNNIAKLRGISGGTWIDRVGYLSAAEAPGGNPPDSEDATIGFRVARISVPEPSCLALFAVAAVMLGSRLRGRRY